jgi:GTP-binding protein Era
MDTPGIHKTRTALHKSMVDSALAAFQEVDFLLLMIEMIHPNDPEIPSIIKNLKSIKKPCILAINKIDLGPRDQLLEIIDDFNKIYVFEAIIPISALNGDGVDILLEELKSRIVNGPQYFPVDMKTDKPESFIVSEIIREKIYLYLKKELPYSSAVTVERIEEKPGKDMLFISGVIHVETDSQKGILIGRNGRMIKNIGKSARLDLEKFFGIKVYLDLAVKVNKNWSRDPKSLSRLGY